MSLEILYQCTTNCELVSFLFYLRATYIIVRKSALFESAVKNEKTAIARPTTNNRIVSILIARD